MDQEIPEYDMDSEDEQWLNQQVKHLKMDVSSLKFESMMDRLEKGSGQMVCTSILDMFFKTIFFHWHQLMLTSEGVDSLCKLHSSYCVVYEK